MLLHDPASDGETWAAAHGTALEKLARVLYQIAFGHTSAALIIGLLALSEGLVDVVRASIIGSILGNVLLVAPILVLFSLLAPQRLDLIFSVVEIGALGLAAFLFSEITHDGELVWLEGLLLVLLYAMLAGTVFIFGA